jgi:DNA-directed RNA polymerase specialized sigma24 family protein
LDTDRDRAAQKYETIRASLIRIFIAKGCSDAEDLADEAFSRVAKKLPEIRDGYVGEPAYYFRGVARNLIHEVRRRREIATEVVPVDWIPVPIRSSLYDCLLRCLKFLAPAKRELILDYHVYEGHDKIEFHRIMAEELGISEGALRGRAFHLRAELERCVLECTQNLNQKTKGPAQTIVNSGAVTRSVNHGRGKSTSN